MAFVNQAAPEIWHKLQRIGRLGDKSLQELLVVVEKVCNKKHLRRNTMTTANE